MLKTNQGTAVVIALLTLLVLSILGASVMFSTQAEITTTYNFKRLTQARYAAEAGAQNTANWLIYNYTVPVPASFGSYNMTTSPVQSGGQNVVLSAMSGVTANYPDSAVQTAFNTALQNQPVSGMDVPITYSTTATLQTMRVVVVFGSATTVPLQSWLIRSQATVGGSQAHVEVTQTIEKFGSPVFPYAAFAVSAICSSITFGGGMTTDSFDSTAGTYAATQLFSGGNAGTNGNAGLNGSSTVVNGTISSPYSGTGACPPMDALSVSGGASVTGGTVTLSSALSYATPPAPSPAPPTGNQNSNGNCGGPPIPGCTNLPANNLYFAPGQYADVKLTGGAILHVSNGIYNMNSLSFAGNSQLIVDSGPVVINIAGAGLTGGQTAVDMTGGTITNISASKPTDLQILYGGSQPVKLAGSSGAYCVAYMPNAPVTFTGGSDWYGAVVGNTITDMGGTNLHYDRSLGANVDIVGNFHTTSFGWSKY